MRNSLVIKTNTHVVDILGNVKGRDQPIMLIDKAIQFAATLDDHIFLDDEVVFFDPFCKAGEILLACALIRCLKKSKNAHGLMGLESVYRELYESNRYYALAPDERHHRLSLRTFLGNENSHKGQFNHVIKNGNYLSEISGKLDSDKFEKELGEMLEYIKKTSENNKIVAIGNPPYQESDGGFGKSAKNIYHYFAEALISKEDISEFVLVIPARWFGGGKGMDGFRDTMMNTQHLKKLKYFNKANSVFPTVDINGGVCFIHFDKKYSGETDFSDESFSEKVDFSEFDIIPDDPFAFTIIRKIQGKWNGIYVGEKSWPSKPFGLRTNHFDKYPELEKLSPLAVPCLSRGKVIKIASKLDISKNKDKINYWKVSVPKAAGGSKGKRRSTVPLNQIFLVPPGHITTETYNIIDIFEVKSHAENFRAYLKTDFSRYMVGLRKITQDVPPDRWNWVPYMENNKTWTDEALFKYFNITKEEQDHIKKKVKEWS